MSLIASPLWNTKHLRQKAEAKLGLVLAAMLVYWLATPSKTATIAHCCVLAELVLDAICFSTLLLYRPKQQRDSLIGSKK